MRVNLVYTIILVSFGTFQGKIAFSMPQAEHFITPIVQRLAQWHNPNTINSDLSNYYSDGYQDGFSSKQRRKLGKGYEAGYLDGEVAWLTFRKVIKSSSEESNFSHFFQEETLNMQNKRSSHANSSLMEHGDPATKCKMRNFGISDYLPDWFSVTRNY